MKKSVTIASVVLSSVALAGTLAFAQSGDAPYAGSRFSDVWAQVTSDRYTALPHQAVTTASFFGFLEDKLLAACRRTLSNGNDVLPHFQKLLHPNGVCLAGTWTITEETPYTGYFRKGSQGLFIGRASTALTAVRRGEYRAFGFAGKLFPTMDPQAEVKTANFFTIENLGGTLTPHFLDAENTNDILKVTLTPTAFLNTAVGAEAVKAFATADETLDLTQPFVRQVYPIAELGEADPSAAVSPRWLEIVGSESTPRFDAEDFRDELDISHYPDGIRLDIRTADVGSRLGERQWRTIGTIELKESAASDSCDHRLHFSHPRFRH